MRRIEEDRKRRPVVVEFTHQEAKDFAGSLMADVSWSDTGQRELYSELYYILAEAYHEEE